MSLLKEMLSKSFLKKFAIFATLLSIISNIFIFTYPSLHPTQCSWKCFDKPTEDIQALSSWEKVVFYVRRYFDDVREQTFGGQDQKAGDEDQPSDVHMLAFGDPQIKGIWKKTPYITRLDIFGNDYYLGHIASMMKKRLHPSHMVVMGDLFSSQWIGDSEFYNRTERYTSRIFGRDTSWLKDIKEESHDHEGYKVNWRKWGDAFNAIRSTEKPWDFGFDYNDVYSWDPENEDSLFINITGNHDIGYSGDITYQHISRFHELFGKVNYWIEYDTDTDHPWRIVVLNSLALEGPALQPEFIETTWEFLYQLFERRFQGSTVLLTHVPFYKKEGLCSDGPEFDYYPKDFEREPYKANLLRSQNHLSEDVTNRVLNLIFDNDKPGIILTGHDHVGCETMYNKNSKEGTWTAAAKKESQDLVIEEITVKSMMGEFDGNTGLVTGHFNKRLGTWEWSFTLCPFAIQHVWWFAKVSALVTGFLWSLYILV